MLKMNVVLIEQRFTRCEAASRNRLIEELNKHVAVFIFKLGTTSHKFSHVLRLCVPWLESRWSSCTLPRAQAILREWRFNVCVHHVGEETRIVFENEPAHDVYQCHNIALY